jgi:hypothetical protein
MDTATLMTRARAAAKNAFTEPPFPMLSEHREIEKFIIRQSPKGEKDDYDSD